jgi:nicotinic acid mononucleotide adenylyltransferase
MFSWSWWKLIVQLTQFVCFSNPQHSASNPSVSGLHPSGTLTLTEKVLIGETAIRATYIRKRAAPSFTLLPLFLALKPYL